MNQGTTDSSPSAPPPAPIRWLVALTRVLIPLIILAASIYGAMLLLAAKPEDLMVEPRLFYLRECFRVEWRA